MRKSSLSWLSTFCMIGLAIFMFYYPYQVLSEVIPFAFTQPDLWENHWLVKYDGEIPFVLRACYLTLWLIPILATVAMTATAIHFFYRNALSTFPDLEYSEIRKWMLNRMNEYHGKGKPKPRRKRRNVSYFPNRLVQQPLPAPKSRPRSSRHFRDEYDADADPLCNHHQPVPFVCNSRKSPDSTLCGSRSL